MLNTQQIRLVQTAVRAAGLRTKQFEGRYRMLLGQYKQPSGKPVTSCKQLNNSQLEDLLAICEAHGWRMPGKSENYYRQKVSRQYDVASFAQQSAIGKLAGDLGWGDLQLGGFLKKMTAGFTTNVSGLTPAQAYKIIEALKAMFGREQGKQYSNLKQIQDDLSAGRQDMEAVTDGKKKSQVG